VALGVPTSPGHEGSARRPGRAGVLELLGSIAALGVVIALVASIGGPHSPGVGLIVVIERLAVSGWPAAVYLLASVGLGGLIAPIWRGAREDGALRLGVGLAAMLSVSHLLGVAGTDGILAAWIPLGVGLAAGCWSGIRWARAHGRPLVRSPGLWAIFWIVPLGVLIVAASNPPGWLWQSEAYGYDVLSYHLQLAQEWIGGGQIEPVEHNVYSFLPGYVEAATWHLAQATGVAGQSADRWPTGLLAGGGWRVFTAQYLHAMIAVCAAWLGVRATCRAIELSRTGRASVEVDERDVARGASVDAGPVPMLAGALLLATPWTVVVGSMAYNEMAVVALGLAAMLAAGERALSPIVRGLLVGAMVGVACGAKPTALVLVGPAAGVALIAGLWTSVPGGAWESRAGRLGRAVLAGGAVGCAALLPWLVRNHMASGNPVFPQLAGVFGTGHWTDEQVERFAGAHFFDGSAGERLSMLVWPIGEASRGITHAQWGVMTIALIAGIVLSLARARSRAVAGVLGVGLALQIIAWMGATHLQSRFLVPTLIVAVPLVGLGAWWSGAIGARAGRWALAAAVVAQSWVLVAVFATERPDGDGRGHPNRLLLGGTRWFTGEQAALALERATTQGERRRVVEGLTPEQHVNLFVERATPVYLLGGATPFYVRAPVVYHTTWDASPLGDAMRAWPEEPEAWTRALDRRGIGVVLVDRGELDRLGERDGWYDPAVTLDAVDAWIAGAGRVLRVWDRGRVVLLELDPASQSGGDRGRDRGATSDTGQAQRRRDG